MEVKLFMKYDAIYQTTIGCANPAEVFAYLTGSLIESITYWEYFVGWNKAQNNLRPFEIDLNTLNYLVGKPNVEAEFRLLLEQQPGIARLIPLLLACREKKFTILTDYSSGIFQYETFSFNTENLLTSAEIDKLCRFARETRLLEMFGNGRIKSVPDYVFGVEVGLDSNARKNRSGTQMDTIVNQLLVEICNHYSYSLIRQATPRQLRTEWGINIAVDKANRTFDFAVRANDKLYLVETNYYGGGGSKLKATAGEYKQLYDFLTRQGHKFIWITDGAGWITAKNSLEEAFYHLEHLLNLKMVTSGFCSTFLK